MMLASEGTWSAERNTDVDRTAWLQDYKIFSSDPDCSHKCLSALVDIGTFLWHEACEKACAKLAPRPRQTRSVKSVRTGWAVSRDLPLRAMWATACYPHGRTKWGRRSRDREWHAMVRCILIPAQCRQFRSSRRTGFYVLCSLSVPPNNSLSSCPGGEIGRHVGLRSLYGVSFSWSPILNLRTIITSW
jgi:hypothetical protein